MNSLENEDKNLTKDRTNIFTVSNWNQHAAMVIRNLKSI